MRSVNKDLFYTGSKPAVVYMGASWCSSCPAVEAELRHHADKYPDWDFQKVDVTTDAIIAEAFRVQSLPTVIIFEDGKEAARFTGSTAAKRAIERIKHGSLHQ